MLGRLDATRNIDVKAMLQAMSTTMDFEAKLDLRFGVAAKQKSGSESYSIDHAIDPSSRFYLIIASCFVPYLDHYIQAESDTLYSMLKEDGASSSTAEDVEDGLLASGTRLFQAYRQTMLQFTRFSNGKPFLDLGKMFAKHLLAYADILRLKLAVIPASSSSGANNGPGISDSDVRMAAVVVNTAEYCVSTVSQLEARFTERINEQFRGLVNFSNERDEFFKFVGAWMRLPLMYIIVLPVRVFPGLHPV